MRHERKVVPIRDDIPLQRRELHPEARVYLFGSMKAVQTGMEDYGDISQMPSDKDTRAKQLGVTLDAARPRTTDVDTTGCFDYVICSGAARAQLTATEAVHHYGVRYDCVGQGLYAPKGEEDLAAMRKVLREIASLIAIRSIEPEMAYPAFRVQDTTRCLVRFMTETRELVFSRPGIADARHIAIFTHEIVGNAVGEALFPQHARALETLQLGPGDCILLTKDTCRYFPLLPQFR